MLLYQLSTPACQALTPPRPVAIVTGPTVPMVEKQSLLKQFSLLASSSVLVKMLSSGYTHAHTHTHMHMNAYIPLLWSNNSKLV